MQKTADEVTVKQVQKASVPVPLASIWILMHQKYHNNC